MDDRRTLLVTRALLNTDEVAAWAARNGLGRLWGSPHVTVAYSRRPIDWSRLGSPDQSMLTISPDNTRSIEQLAEGALALMFNSPELAGRHAQIIAAGASWDWPSYRPHVTIAYVDASPIQSIEPFRGRLIFSAERLAEIATKTMP
jgi:2'-5' RNA ligase